MPKSRSTKQLPLKITEITFSVLLLLWFCNLTHAADNNSYSADLGQRIKEKETEVQLLINEKIEWQGNINLFQENRIRKIDLTSKRQQLKGMLDEIEQLKKNIESIKSRKEELTHQYRNHIDQIRTNAIDEKIESLKATDDEEYKDVTIKEIHPDSMKISHSTGVANIPFEKLPKGLQDRFRFNPKDAAAHRKKGAAQQLLLNNRLKQIQAQQKPKAPPKAKAHPVVKKQPIAMPEKEPPQVDGRISARVIASNRNGDRVSKKIEIRARAGTEQMRIVVSSMRGGGTRNVAARETAVYTMWVDSKYSVKAYQNGHLIDEQSSLRKRGLGL